MPVKGDSLSRRDPDDLRARAERAGGSARPVSAVLASRGRLEIAMLGVGILLLALNLRPAITGMPPIFRELRRQLGLSSGSLTLLAALPLLCFAALSPVVARLGRKFGEELVLGGALAVLALALLLRGAFASVSLFPATIAAAAAITALNVLVPSLIKRRQPQHAGLFLGEYLLALYIGGTVGTLVAVPLYESSGHSLPITLGGWSILAVVGFIIWLPQTRRRRAPTPVSVTPTVGSGHVFRTAVGWQVSCYFGLQSLGYYACISWLPTFFRDRGAAAAHAGLLASMLGTGGPPHGAPRPDLRPATARSPRPRGTDLPRHHDGLRGNNVCADRQRDLLDRAARLGPGRLDGSCHLLLGRTQPHSRGGGIPVGNVADRWISVRGRRPARGRIAPCDNGKLGGADGPPGSMFGLQLLAGLLAGRDVAIG